MNGKFKLFQFKSNEIMKKKLNNNLFLFLKNHLNISNIAFDYKRSHTYKV
jgi:hypothetical protein